MTVCSKHILLDLSSRLASNDTIDSVLRHREVGRAKDISAPGIYGRFILVPYYLHLGHPSSLVIQRDPLLISCNIPNPSLPPKFWFIFWRPLIKIISMALKFIFLTLCSHTYYMHHKLRRFLIILTIKCSYISNQYWHICHCNGDAVCFLWRINSVFKYCVTELQVSNS